jgi:hypothetical protein
MAQLAAPDDPEHASNRRISVIVQYLVSKPAAPSASDKGATPAASPPPQANPGARTGNPAGGRK